MSVEQYIVDILSGITHKALKLVSNGVPSCNRYAIDSQNQYSRRENIRISCIVEEEDEVLLDKFSNICNAMGVNVNNADIISCHRVGHKARPNIHAPSLYDVQETLNPKFSPTSKHCMASLNFV